MKIIFTLRNDEDFAQRFKRDKKSPLYFLEWKALIIIWNIIIGRHELKIGWTTINLETEL